MKNRQLSKGFTLIEVLIVVVIMAILAATVIPQFANTSTDAKLSTLKLNVHTLRSQIELYKIHHDGAVPTIGTIPPSATPTLPQLLLATDLQGTTNATPNATYPYGPYIANEFPANPFTNLNAVRGVTTWPPTAAGSGGWVYNTTTGQIAPDDPAHIGL